jgi:hypothetical protein
MVHRRRIGRGERGADVLRGRGRRALPRVGVRKESVDNGRVQFPVRGALSRRAESLDRGAGLYRFGHVASFQRQLALKGGGDPTGKVELLVYEGQRIRWMKHDNVNLRTRGPVDAEDSPLRDDAVVRRQPVPKQLGPVLLTLVSRRAWVFGRAFTDTLVLFGHRPTGRRLKSMRSWDMGAIASPTSLMARTQRSHNTPMRASMSSRVHRNDVDAALDLPRAGGTRRRSFVDVSDTSEWGTSHPWRGRGSRQRADRGGRRSRS